MSAVKGSIDRRREGSDEIVALVGELDMDDVQGLRALLGEVAGMSGRVVVDMSETDFIDSTVIGAILLAHRDGCAIVLRNAHGEPRRALDIAGALDVVGLED